MITIYHNPRCSKSRQTLQLLEEKGISPKIVFYLDEHLSEEELRSLSQKLDISPFEFVRKGEQQYKDLVSTSGEPDKNTLFNWMSQHPILIERPIVVKGSKAILGRPPENVLDLL